jgi:hypothetical protein
MSGGLRGCSEWFWGRVPHEVEKKAIAELAVTEVDERVPVTFSFVESTEFLRVGELGGYVVACSLGRESDVSAWVVTFQSVLDEEANVLAAVVANGDGD